MLDTVTSDWIGVTVILNKLEDMKAFNEKVGSEYGSCYRLFGNHISLIILYLNVLQVSTLMPVRKSSKEEEQGLTSSKKKMLSCPVDQR